MVNAQRHFDEISSDLKSQIEKRRDYENKILTLQKKSTAAQNKLLITEHDLEIQMKLQKTNKDNEAKFIEELNQIEEETSAFQREKVNLNEQILI